MSSDDLDTSPAFDKNSFCCPHCGVVSQFEKHMIPLTYKGSLFMRSSPLSGFVEHKASDFLDFMDPDEYSVKRCTNCGELTLWRRRRLVYPQNSGITPVDCMPDHAKEPFTEAQSIATVSPRAACAMLRICVERMVNSTEAKGGNLAAKIESLGLPPKMKKLAHACRLVGNDAVHNNVIDFSVGSEEAKVVSEALSRFANRIAEELFGMSAEADEWTDKIDAARAKKH